MSSQRLFLPCRRIFSRNFTKWSQPTGHSTELKIYNRLSNSTVEVVTKLPNVLTWYCCGPTVYDSPHLGHACSYMQFDLIRKIMENLAGLNVVMLMSVTDVDDKIIARAAEEKCALSQISSKFEREFNDAMAALGIAPPSVALRVSEHIPDIVEFIGRIFDRGLAYVGKDGSVYFTVDKYPYYGKLAPAQEERKSADVKRSNLDFALWKAAKPGEPFWDSPWGSGRPGWHIECSAMASKYFGNCVDFHSGGIDLLFPHHENEEAQSCAHHDSRQWVNYWLHSGHLHLDGDVKMSKSLKNTVSVWDFLEEYYPQHLRTLCMLVPYRNGVEYSREVMVNAVNVYSKIVNFLSDADAYVRTVGPKANVDDGSLLTDLQQVRDKIRNCLLLDFNTSSAMNELSGLIGRASSQMNSAIKSEHGTSIAIIAVKNYVEKFLKEMGFSSGEKAKNDSFLIGQLIEPSLKFRSSVRQLALSSSHLNEHKETKKALLLACDEFRNDFKELGVEIKDRANASTWNQVVAAKRLK